MDLFENALVVRDYLRNATELDFWEKVAEAKTIHGIEVKFKDESLLQKFLGAILRPFSPDFMSRFTTTIGNTIYFPSKDYVKNDPGAAIIILKHELEHVKQYQRDWFFSLRYLLFKSERCRYETEGYFVSTYLDALRACDGNFEDFCKKLDEQKPWLKQIFTGPAYVWMCSEEDFEEKVWKRMNKDRSYYIYLLCRFF